MSISLFITQGANAGDYKSRLSILPLENPAGWAAPYDPGRIIGEMLKLSIEGQGSFHLSPPPSQIGSKSKSPKSQLKHPFQYILSGKVLHFTPGKPPSRAQIILNIGDALKQKAELQIEMELTNHHLGSSIAKKKFKLTSIDGTVPFDLDTSAVDFDSQDFLNSSIGKALVDLNHQIHAFVVTSLHPLPLDAEVISVNPDKMEVVINVGKLNGIDFGDLFNVYSVVLQYKDPFTEMNLGNKFFRRGVIRVKDVQEGFSIAAIVAGNGFAMGELARSRKIIPVILNRNHTEHKEQHPLWESHENSAVRDTYLVN